MRNSTIKWLRHKGIGQKVLVLSTSNKGKKKSILPYSSDLVKLRLIIPVGDMVLAYSLIVLTEEVVRKELWVEQSVVEIVWLKTIECTNNSNVKNPWVLIVIIKEG